MLGRHLVAALGLCITVLASGCFEAEIPAATLRCSLGEERPCPAGMVCQGHDAQGNDGRCYPEGQTLRKLTRHGRWFKLGGDYVYLVGAGLESLAGRIPGAEGKWDGDLPLLLDEFQAAGINMIRVWANCSFVPPDAVRQPFLRLPSGKYDLDRWDPAYWSRLRELARLAQQRAMVMAYTLFSAQEKASSWTEAANYWNRANNENGAFTDADGVPGAYLDFFTNAGGETSDSGHDLAYYQRRLIDKAAAELRGHGNVFFQILGNPGDDSPNDAAISPWTLARAHAVHAGHGLLAAALAGGANKDGRLSRYAGAADVDILGTSTYGASPGAVSDRLHALQRTGQILLNDDTLDPRTSLAKVVREAWGWALSGGQVTFRVNDSDLHLVGDGTWKRLADAARTLHETMTSLRFFDMSPVDDQGAEHDTLVTAGPADAWQVLASRTGSEYLVYFWDGKASATAAAIELKGGRSYEARWIDPRAGSVLATHTLPGGKQATVPAPATASWDLNYGLVLVIRGTI